MKTIKHNLLILFLFCITLVFSQDKTKKSTERFNVNNDVIVEINTSFTDITVKHWSRNEVLVESILTVDGVTKEEAEQYFDDWNIESLGNKSKVIITSNPNGLFVMKDFDVDSDFDFDLDFDFEPVIAYALKFDSDSFPSPPEMPVIVIKHLNKIQWDQKAYEKDKEKYLIKFEKQMEAYEKEVEENLEPQIEAYEKEMEKWEIEFEKKFEPQMEAYEKEMEKWEKEIEIKLAPMLKEHEDRINSNEKQIKIHVKKIEKNLDEHHDTMNKMKKKIVIKIPKNARVKLNAQHGTLNLPDDLKKL